MSSQGDRRPDPTPEAGPAPGPTQEPRPSDAQILAARDAWAERLGLTLGTAFPEGSTGWVGAATGAGGEDLVLKVAWAHEEARDEALGMSIWSAGRDSGRDAPGPIVPHVLEARREGALSVLLMERVRPGATLARSGLPPQQEDEVVAGLLRHLWIPADDLPGAPQHGFRPLAHMCAWWADEAAERLARDSRGLPEELVRRGLDLFRALPRERGVPEVLLATDLHHHNVLAADGEVPDRGVSWRAIDPKPYVGDPHYDLLQHMFNAEDRLVEDPSGFSARMAHLTGLDPERTARWLLARCVQEAPGADAAARAAMRLAADGV
ncbi:kinase [Brachybacterium sp. MASK1Z-5]|uniref:Kinase n=1 Tax=Brachybacterium halotolerans TaxID=2795215 RepID=A0ABS1BAP6_9MICO|nr:aminoglycoside phosphotransferase family protein [Brachybacterium halotolerans]MBK0331731.1 kinase [Brachybacterium halotolerans]